MELPLFVQDIGVAHGGWMHGRATPQARTGRTMPTRSIASRAGVVCDAQGLQAASFDFRPFGFAGAMTAKDWMAGGLAR